MCIRDSVEVTLLTNSLASNDVIAAHAGYAVHRRRLLQLGVCLLYTSDAADERSSVDLGGRRIIKKKTNDKQSSSVTPYSRQSLTATYQPTELIA